MCTQTVRRASLCVAIALMLVPSFAAESAPGSATVAVAEPAPTPVGCGEDLTFAFEEAGFCPAPQDETELLLDEVQIPGSGSNDLAVQPTAKPPRPLGFCRCGCGIRCQSSADCDGGSCDRFITCC